jgi:DNA-binding response OmpR family regulator
MSQLMSGLHILIVEDDPVMTEMLGKYCQAYEGSVLITYEIAASLTMALDRVKMPGIDVVLLDLVLPDCEGLTGILRVFIAAPFLPIVVLTGLPDEELESQCFKLGAIDYIHKTELGYDITVDDFIWRLREAAIRTKERVRIFKKYYPLEEKIKQARSTANAIASGNIDYLINRALNTGEKKDASQSSSG